MFMENETHPKFEVDPEDDNPSYGSRQGSDSYKRNLAQARRRMRSEEEPKEDKDPLAAQKFKRFYSTLSYDERTEYANMSEEEKAAFRRKKENEPRFE